MTKVSKRALCLINDSCTLKAKKLPLKGNEASKLLKPTVDKPVRIPRKLSSAGCTAKWGVIWIGSGLWHPLTDQIWYWQYPQLHAVDGFVRLLNYPFSFSHISSLAVSGIRHKYYWKCGELN